MAQITKRKRLSIDKIRAVHKCTELTNRGLPKQKEAALSVLAQHREFDHITQKVQSCTRKRPCNNKWCTTCSNPRKRRSKRHLKSDRRLTQNACNGTSTALGALSSNYQVRGGQRMVEPFVGLPLILLHCITINLALVALDGSLCDEIERIKRRLRKALNRLTPGHIARGKFDMVLKTIDGLTFDIPEEELDRTALKSHIAGQRCGMLHIHFVLFDPWMSSEEIRKVLVAEFPGRKRVCVRAPYQDIKHDDGTVTHGVQGFLEYASLEKVEIDFGMDSAQAVIEFARLDETWSRRNRNFSTGKRPDDINTIVDTDRVKELEAQRFRKRIKKNWKTLSYAEQFIHIWMTDPKGCLETVKTRTFARIIDDFPDILLSYMSNSSPPPDFETPIKKGANWIVSSGLYGKLVSQPSD
ncbi:hypothetical protein [uncultured Roseobacter sp.]|uniref:hypothetical protein n=1 Tax=uncultured Roseobacter sp. TaxID=114847 RepID=UPI00262CAAFC|nr:hypothetical protein [uncultured Roseobacter sp.]